MAYFEDLRACDYFGRVEGRLLAVGWLDHDHSIPTGRVSATLFTMLAKLVPSAWQPVALAGRHRCEFCVFTGGPTELRVAGVNVAVGAANLFIPSERAVYVAPSLVIHYI